MSEGTQAPADGGQVADATPSDAGQAQETWYSSAPDEVKGYIQNKGWDDPVKAVTSYQELEKYHGVSPERILKLPENMEDADALGSIYDRLGRPEKAENYDFKAPDGLPLDEQRLGGAKDIAHKLGLNQKQFEALAQFDAEYQMQAMQAHNEQIEQQQAAEYEALKQEWGSNAAEREELSRRGLKAILPQGMEANETVAKIEEAIGTAATLKLFANVGDKLAREDALPENTDRPSFGYTREQALSDKQTLMNELKADKDRLNMYNTGKGNDFEKMQRLNKYITGS